MAGKIHRNSLQPDYKLHWYEIKEILGQGGFGITYLAYDTNLDEDVAIKEFLPIELAMREGDFSIHPLSDGHKDNYEWGLDRFIKEARTLTKFKHPSIVRVRSVFKENNTAYMVMEYEHGESLQELLTRRKTLEEVELIKIIIPLLAGLDKVHEIGFIHRDIKPANIFIRQDDSPLLLDFGSARQALGEETKTLTSLVSAGYAPFEQYYSKSDEQGPYTDIYGLGATMYRAITGRPPMDAVDRSKAILEASHDVYVSAVEMGKGKYSERFLRAIDHSLQFKRQDRPQTIEEWKSEFELPEDPIKEAGLVEQQVTQPGKTVLARQQKTKSIKLITLVTLFISITVALYFVGSTIVSDWQQEKGDEISRQLKAEDEQRLALLGKKRLEQEAAQQLAEEKRIAEEKKRLEEEAHLEQKQHIVDLVKAAEEAMTQGRLVQPVGNNAFDTYIQILKLEPDNEMAVAGKSKVFQALISNAESFIKENKFNDAEGMLAKADAIEPDSVKVRLARVKLEDIKKEQQRLADLERQKQEDQKIKQEEAKRLAELEKQRQKELKDIEKEKLKLEEARKKLEVGRQFELERIRQEEEAKRKAKDERLRAEQEVRARTEAEAQRKEEESHLQREQQLFAEYMQNGESAMNKKEYSEALRAYTLALEIFPNDSAALRGKSLASDYKNLCTGVACW